MKKVNFLFAILMLASIFNSSAQSKSGKILKVEYETNNVSEFLVDMLKSQIKDPKKYSEVMNHISQYKVFHTLYFNPKTSESFYVLDSIHEVKGVSTVGHVEYTYFDSKNKISGKEVFMKKPIEFNDNGDSVQWNITKEKKEINGFQAIKATLKKNPEIEVWFTPEIAVKTGPYIYAGLPGLVLESHGIFTTTNVMKVQYLENDSIMKERESQTIGLVIENGTSIDEVLTKKKNFQTMASQGKK